MHVTLQFPALHNCLDNSKDLPLQSMFRYVNIHRGHAVLVTSTTTICVDLRDYFIGYHTVEETERHAFEELMKWLEGKSFTDKFWKFLTQKNEISIVADNKIKIVGESLEKILVYEPVEVNIESAMSILVNNIENHKSAVPAVGISMHNFNIISKTVGKMIGKNVLVFEFLSASSTIRFTVNEMNFIFGVILSSGSPTLKPFNFEPFKKFTTPQLF